MSHNLKGLHTDFLEELELAQGRSGKTVENYDHYLKRFYKQQGIEVVSDVTLNAVREFRRYLRDEIGAAPPTINYHLIAIRQLLKFLARQDVPALASEKIGLAKLAERDIDVLYPEEIDALLAAPALLHKQDKKADESATKLAYLRDAAILRTLFSTGMRISEAVALNRDDVRISTNEIPVRGKGNKVRVVFLSEDARQALATYLEARHDTDPALFIRHKKGAAAPDTLRLSPRTVQRLMKKYAAAAGLTKQVTPHTLRHCLHKDTRVVLNPEVLPAQQVFESQRGSVLSFDFKQNKVVRGKIVRHFSHKSTPLLQIWASGRELVCSPRHTLFTVSEEGVVPILASELRPGMFVAGIKAIQFQGKKSRPPEFWRLVGYIIGDGVLSEARHGVVISEKDKRIVDFYISLIEEVTGRSPTVTDFRDRNSFGINIYNMDFLRELRKLGITQKSPERRLPQSLMRATREEVAACLAGLYDAEGNTGQIKIFSTSKDLLKDMQLALLRLEIDSSINVRHRRVKLPQGKIIKNTIYTLHVLQKPSQERFRKLIPTLKTVKILPRNVDWKLPTQPIFERLYRLAKQKKSSVGSEGAARRGIRHVARYQRLCTTPEILQKLIEGFIEQGVEQSIITALSQVLSLSNLKWLKVLTCEELPGSEEVYDFTITPHSNFITDGFISHNSFATDLLSNGADVRQVQQLLGHASITTTQVYTHLTDAHLRDVHERFHGKGSGNR